MRIVSKDMNLRKENIKLQWAIELSKKEIKVLIVKHLGKNQRVITNKERTIIVRHHSLINKYWDRAHNYMVIDGTYLFSRIKIYLELEI